MRYDNLDVLVLTYNRADYLRIQLDSIFQSCADWRETIIIDNASTDHTGEVLKEAAEKYPNRKMRVIRHEKNIGNAGNFIFSQSVAENEYVAVFHDDDAIHPEYIDRAMYLLSNNKNAVMCFGNAEPLYNVTNENWPMLPNEYWLYPQSEGGAFAQLMVGRGLFMSCIYKTSAYKQVEYRPDRYGKLHDTPFMMEISRFGEIIFQQGTVVRWRQHAKSASNTLSTGPYPHEVLQLITDLNTLLEKDKPYFADIEKYDELASALLYNFAYFLYEWSCLRKCIRWDDFRKELKENGVFSEAQYAVYDKDMDHIFNPMIIQTASKMREEYRHQYYYRVGGM